MQRKLVRDSWDLHAEERGQEAQAAAGPRTLMSVAVTRDGPGGKPRADCNLPQSSTRAFQARHAIPSPKQILRAVWEMKEP